MKIYDITIPIHPGMPVWPGDSGVRIEQESSIASGANANVSRLELGAHTGTHVDAPYHFVPTGVTLEAVPLEAFVGPAWVAEILGTNLVTAAHLESAGIPPDTRRVLFKTDNTRIWERAEGAFERDFVALSPDAAQFLVDRDVSLVGIDYLSIAPFGDSRPTHQILLGAGVVVLEGVDLRAVAPGAYSLYCLPLKLVGVDGAPARAILVEEPA